MLSRRGGSGGAAPGITPLESLQHSETHHHDGGAEHQFFSCRRWGQNSRAGWGHFWLSFLATAQCRTAPQSRRSSFHHQPLLQHGLSNLSNMVLACTYQITLYTRGQPARKARSGPHILSLHCRQAATSLTNIFAGVICQDRPLSPGSRPGVELQHSRGAATKY